MVLLKSSGVLFFTLFLTQLVSGQGFEQRTVDAGNLGLNVTNVGTFGRPNIRNDPGGSPSMEYPVNSGIEHLFEGGFWIGGYVDGELRVSTSAIDASSGYSTGQTGFEFTALGGIQEKSSLTESDVFSATAVSHQDFIIKVTDSNVVVPGTSQPVSGHEFPLDAVVTENCYAWNYSFADFFVIVNFEIENKSNKAWDSVYLAWWSDMVVRNVNVTQESGSAFFNKGGAGVLEDNSAFYVFQVSGDDVDYTNSYGAASILGVDWQGEFFHPNNAQLFIDKGLKPPMVNYNFWEFNSQSGGDFTFPSSEEEKYFRLSNSVGLQKPDFKDRLKNASNKIQLVSIGPIPTIAPGEKVSFAVALVAAKQLYDPEATGTSDTEPARKELIEHLGWARRTYLGEDTNENGKLDHEEDSNENGVLDDDEDINKNGVWEREDLNGNGKLDRYVLPEPPKTPKVKLIPGDGFVDIYWDREAVNSVDPISKKMDFEGFRLYRTNTGDDIGGDLVSSAKLIAQWDSTDNSVGFNNGFSAVELDEPIEIEGETYEFHYKLKGLLNGWQYFVIVTSFDEGDDELGLAPLESSFTANSQRVWSGTDATPIEPNAEQKIGVYPNPYSTSALWDGSGAKTQKLYFYNLPEDCTITIFTSSGDVVDQFNHNANTYTGSDIRWYNDLGGDEETRVLPGGEHAWDLLSSAGQSLAQGVYLYSVEDHSTGEIVQGTFAILK